MTHHQVSLGPVGFLVVTLFTVMAFAVTIWTLTGLTLICVNSVKLRNAVIVDAEILDIQKRVVASGDGTTLEVTVTYSYEFNGQHFEHQTQKLGLFGVSGKFHDILDEALRTGEVVSCYVDPDDPSMSLFSKRFSVSMFLVTLIFPIAFGSTAFVCTKELIRQYRNGS